MKQRIYVFNGIEQKNSIILFFIFIIILFAAIGLLYKGSSLIDYYSTVFDFKYVIVIILLLMLGFYKLIKYIFESIVGKPKSWTIELNEEICITNDKESFSIFPGDLIKIEALATENKGLLFLKTAEKRFSLSISIDIKITKDNLLTKSNLIIFTQFINDLEEYFLEKGFNLKKLDINNIFKNIVKKNSNTNNFYFNKE